MAAHAGAGGPPRRRRPAAPRRRHLGQHQRAQADRGRPPPVAEDRGARHARRRHRARLQQHPGGHPRQRRPRRRLPRAGRTSWPTGWPRSGRPRMRASDLVRRIKVFGQAGETRHEPVDLVLVVEEVLRLLRSTLPAGIVLKTEFASDTPQSARRHRPGARGDREPEHQRGLRDRPAAGRHHLPARRRRGGRDDGGRHAGAPARPSRAIDGVGYRLRDGRVAARSHLRRVLHDQARGARGRPRAVGRPRHHEEPRRRGDGGEHARPGLALFAVLPEGAGRAGHAGR